VNDGAATWAEIAQEIAETIGRPLKMKPLTLETAALRARGRGIAHFPGEAGGGGHRHAHVAGCASTIPGRLLKKGHRRTLKPLKDTDEH
jgi:hypothetical protein